VAETLHSTAQAPRARGSKRLLALRNDEHVVARVRTGEQAAFEVLYDRYAEVLLSFCRHMLGRADEAEDAVQQVFVSAHAALLRDDREIEAKPWLYAIARNRCLSMLRARRELPAADVQPEIEGLQDEVQTRVDLRELVADLGDLPEQQRAALLLTELEDLSHADAAAVLDCEASQVKGLVFRARAGLIERRDSRATPCESIRQELATARRGTLRKGHLKHHLSQCAGCTAYLEEVRTQRRMIALVLPVAPGVGLKSSVLEAAGLGGATAGAGLTLAGSSAITGIAVKVAAAGVLVGGVGVASHRALDQPAGGGADPRPPASVSRRPPVAAPPGIAHARPRAARIEARAAVIRGRNRAARRAAATKEAAAKARLAAKQSASARGTAPPGQASNPGRALGRGSSSPQAGPRTNANGNTRNVPGARPGTRAHGAPSPAPRAGPKKGGTARGRQQP